MVPIEQGQNPFIDDRCEEKIFEELKGFCFIVYKLEKLSAKRSMVPLN